MTSAPIVLRHGERYGDLRVIRTTPSGRYRCGCSCGNSAEMFRAKALMNGRVKSCGRCRQEPACKDRT